MEVRKEILGGTWRVCVSNQHQTTGGWSLWAELNWQLESLLKHNADFGENKLQINNLLRTYYTESDNFHLLMKQNNVFLICSQFIVKTAHFHWQIKNSQFLWLKGNLLDCSGERESVQFYQTLQLIICYFLKVLFLFTWKR